MKFVLLRLGERIPRHVKSIHNGQKFTCEICSITLNRKSNLTRHKKIVHGVNVVPVRDVPLKIVPASNAITPVVTVVVVQPLPTTDFESRCMKFYYYYFK